MKPSNKNKKIHRTLEKMMIWLDYYMGRTHEFKHFKDTEYSEMIEDIDYVCDESKIHDIKLANKIKSKLKNGR